MARMSKGQISTEYMIILGITLAAIIPAGYFFMVYSRSSGDTAVKGQLDNIGDQIILSSQTEYGLARGSLQTIDVIFPKELKNISIMSGKELVFNFELSSGAGEAVYFSKVNLSTKICSGCTGSESLPYANSVFDNNTLTPGKHGIRIESKGDYILLELK